MDPFELVPTEIPLEPSPEGGFPFHPRKFICNAFSNVILGRGLPQQEVVTTESIHYDEGTLSKVSRFLHTLIEPRFLAPPFPPLAPYLSLQLSQLSLMSSEQLFNTEAIMSLFSNKGFDRKQFIRSCSADLEIPLLYRLRPNLMVRDSQKGVYFEFLAPLAMNLRISDLCENGDIPRLEIIGKEPFAGAKYELYSVDRDPNSPLHTSDLKEERIINALKSFAEKIQQHLPPGFIVVPGVPDFPNSTVTRIVRKKQDPRIFVDSPGFIFSQVSTNSTHPQFMDNGYIPEVFFSIMREST